MKRAGLAGGAVGLILVLLIWVGLTGWWGGQQGTAETIRPDRELAVEAEATQDQIDVAVRLREISPAIPLYANANYRADLSRRDEAMIRSRYGQNAEVYTLATDDGYPKVWYYYVHYLAQFRGWEPLAPYPARNERWRSRDFDLNEMMIDPFIPGASLENADRHVILQIAETESEPATVIRYIIADRPLAVPANIAAQ